MGTFAIGDIHGCLEALENLVEWMDFSLHDQIITLGDYVDRGPNSKGVIDYLLAMREKHHMVTLRGNHEVAMRRALSERAFLSQWMAPAYGGGATLHSYEAETFSDIPDAHWQFIERALPYHETANHIFVHASVDPNQPLEAQHDETLYWVRFPSAHRHSSGKTVICGHTSQTTGLPKSVGHAICIDTYVYGGGWLTCLNVDTEEYWQTNQQGERRSGNLSELAV